MFGSPVIHITLSDFHGTSSSLQPKLDHPVSQGYYQQQSLLTVTLKRVQKVRAGVADSSSYSQQRYFIFLMPPSVWPYVRWLVTLKDVTFAACWYHTLAGAVSVTAARCKCSLSPKGFPFPKAVRCQDENRNTDQLCWRPWSYTQVKLGYIDLYMVKPSSLCSLVNSAGLQRARGWLLPH